MDTKIEIKEDDPLSDNIASLEFYSKNGAMKANTDNVLLNNDCKIIIKTEIKSETPLLEFCSQNEREFLPKDAVMNTEKCNNDHEVHNKIEIKEEPWWQEAETSHVCDDIKDDDSPATKSPRLCREVFSGDNNDYAEKHLLVISH